MGSGESKGHSKRLPTTSSGFLGRERQVQVRAVGHFSEFLGRDRDVQAQVSRVLYRTIPEE